MMNMSKKIKRAFAASLGLMTPATFAHANISSNISEKIQSVESSSDRINSLCEENPGLSSLLATEIYDKEGKIAGRIVLEPLCEKHRNAYPIIFDIKDPRKKENNEKNKYYKYFTSENEITEDKGKRYFDKHINRINNKIRKDQNIFFTISYSTFDDVTSTYGPSQYVGCIGISRYGNSYNPKKYVPDLEVVINPKYAGKKIASNALGCMINFLNSYNFICKDDHVELIEAIIANENHGSIGMVKKNSFVDLGEVKDSAESNGHLSHRWRLKLNKNPVLERARRNKNQSLIFPCDGSYPQEKVVTFEEFFNSKYYSRYRKKNYVDIKNEILSGIASIVDKKDIDYLKEELSSWPIAWDNQSEKTMTIAIDLEKLPEEISSIKDENLHDKNKKYYIKCPEVLFREKEKLLT